MTEITDTPQEGNAAPLDNAGEPREKLPKHSRNWTLVALIIVSCVAAALLATTITLAVTGDFDNRDGSRRFQEFRRGCGPMPGWEHDGRHDHPRWREDASTPQQETPNDGSSQGQQQQQQQQGQTQPAPQQSQ